MLGIDVFCTTNIVAISLRCNFTKALLSMGLNISKFQIKTDKKSHFLISIILICDHFKNKLIK